MIVPMFRPAAVRVLLAAALSMALVALAACGSAAPATTSAPDADSASMDLASAEFVDDTGLGNARPNIIMITADDMRADEMRYLPRTRALLGEGGMTFTEALTPHPLCCPARAMLLTGQYAHNNGVRSNSGPQGGYKAYDPRRTLAPALQAAGYNTAMVGKHLNAVKFDRMGREPGWTIFDPSMTGYADYYNFGQYNDGDPTYVRDTYYTDYVAERSADYARRLAAEDAPFFMWVSHFGPHSAQRFDCKDETRCESKRPPVLSRSYLADTERVARDRKLARQRTRRLVRGAAFGERARIGKQRYIQRSRPMRRDKLERLVRHRIGALASVDDAIAGLVAQLEADGELDNTYLVFVSDNGYLLGEFGYTGKVVGYEPSVLAPMLVRGPAVTPGTTSQEPAALVDLAPTFLQIAGARPQLRLDGESLLPTLRGRRTTLHPGGVLIQAGAVYAENGRRGWYFRGVRTRRYTYMRFYDGTEELYDRARDRHQIRNVADRPAYRRVRAELVRRTGKLQQCQGAAACNRDFGDMPKPAIPKPGKPKPGKPKPGKPSSDRR
jgi:N-acetylglucosamine-6-sulfatase